MSKRIKNKKNYNYPKENDEVDSYKNAEEKKIVKKKIIKIQKILLIPK